MPEKFNFFIEKILSCDRYWCESLGIYNPYRDPWDLRITKNVPDFDSQFFKKQAQKLVQVDALEILCNTL